jgi:hypothetical protein
MKTLGIWKAEYEEIYRRQVNKKNSYYRHVLWNNMMLKNTFNIIAFSLFKCAYELDKAPFATELYAWRYYIGECVEINPKKALALFKEAERNGWQLSPDAKIVVGHLESLK